MIQKIFKYTKILVCIIFLITIIENVDATCYNQNDICEAANGEDCKSCPQDCTSANYCRWMPSSKSIWLDKNKDVKIQDTEWISSTLTSYNKAGNILEIRDPYLRVSKFFYGNNQEPCTNNPSQNIFNSAYLTCAENQIGQRKIAKYYDDGTISELIDENNLKASYVYDGSQRLIEVYAPDTGGNSESLPLVKYQYEYADNFLSQTPPPGAEECALGFSERCMNRVKTIVTANYRGLTPELEYKKASYLDGLGREAMIDEMLVPGQKHLRTHTLYNELGFVYGTTSKYLQEDTEYIRFSPGSSRNQFLKNLLRRLGFYSDDNIVESRSEEQTFDRDYKVMNINQNIQRSQGSNPGPDFPEYPRPEYASYNVFENSPLGRIIGIYPFSESGFEWHNPEANPYDPHIIRNYGQELPSNTCRLEIDYCIPRQGLYTTLISRINSIPQPECDTAAYQWCIDNNYPGFPSPNSCAYNCNGNQVAGTCQGGQTVLGSISCNTVSDSRVATVMGRYECQVKCGADPIGYIKEKDLAADPYILGYNFEEVIDESGKKVKTYYDRLRNPIRKIFAQGTEDIIIDYTYDVLGRLKGVVNSNKQAIINVFDSAGRLISTTSPDFGKINYSYFDDGKISKRNHNNIETTYSYDTLNRLTTINHDSPSPNIPDAGDIYYVFDTYSSLQGPLYCNIGPNADLKYPFRRGKLLGIVTTNRQTECFIYDEKGRIVEHLVKLPYFSSQIYRTRYEYDLAGNVIRVINPKLIAITYDYENLFRIQGINLNNYILNPSFEINNLDDIPNLPDSWLLSGSSFDFYVLGYGGSVVGSPQLNPRHGQYSYRIKIKSNLANKGIFQLVNLTDGQRYILSFDFHRRDNFPYINPNVLQLKIVDNLGNILNPSQTDFGNTFPEGFWFSVHVSFVARCNNLGSPCQHAIKFLGKLDTNIVEFHLDSIKLEPGERATGLDSTLVEYNFDSTINHTKFGNSVITYYDYNPREWTSFLLINNSFNPELLNRAYSYYDNSNLETISAKSNSIYNEINSFQYDDLNRLERNIIDAQYFGAGNAELWLEYMYDDAGNRLEEFLYDFGVQPPRLTTSDYMYDDDTSVNRLTSMVTTGQPVLEYEYDNRGNIISKREGDVLVETYTYDTENKLTKICYNSPSCTQYDQFKYDEKGLRIYKEKRIDATHFVKTVYIYDLKGSLILEEYIYSHCNDGTAEGQCSTNGFGKCENGNFVAGCGGGTTSPLFLKPTVRRIGEG